MQRLLQEAEELLLQQKGRQQAAQLCQQLKALFAQLDYGVSTKSVAFWVHGQGGKLAYWNMPANAGLLLSNEWDIRGLLAFKKEEKEYLFLVMSENFAGIYLGNGRSLSRLVANAPVNAGGQAGDKLEQTVRHFQNALSILLKVYKLPYIVAAPAPHLEQFRQQSELANAATALIEVRNGINEYGLQQALAPYLNRWQELKEKGLQAALAQAAQQGKLASGIDEVWHAAREKRGRTLVVDADYQYPAYLDAAGNLLYADAIPISPGNHKTKDAVADTMQQVLAGGGNVERVTANSLAQYGHIALLHY